jgi:hypothetical protein
VNLAGQQAFGQGAIDQFPRAHRTSDPLQNCLCGPEILVHVTRLPFRLFSIDESKCAHTEERGSSTGKSRAADASAGAKDRTNHFGGH